jgi:hypothetical protein
MGTEKCLVCVLGQARSWRLTWPSFKRHVLENLEADLALCVGEDSQKVENPFFQHAKHVWEYPEIRDWGDAFDDLADRFCRPRTEWRKLLQIKDQWLGGVLGENAQPGSGAILLFFRWFLVHNIRRNGLIAEYDRFVITRSDYCYLAPHPPISLLKPDKIWIPWGEDYDGLTDRHIVLGKNDLYPALEIASDIVCDTENLFGVMSSKTTWNIEQFIALQFRRRGIMLKVRRFPPPMFTVREEQTTSRGSMGQYDSRVGMIVKYPAELEASLALSETIKTRDDWFRGFRDLNCAASGVPGQRPPLFR